MEQKKNARLENELSAVKRTLAEVKSASVEKQQQHAKQAAAQKGVATRKANELLQKHEAYLKKSNAAIASLKGQVEELKRQLQQAGKEAVRKDRQVAHADSEVARQHAKASVALASLQGRLASAEAQAAAEEKLRKDLRESYNEESLLGAARVLLTGDELEEALRVPSLGSIGAACASVDDLGLRRRRDMGKVVGMLMGRILEIAFAGGEKDPRKVLEAALERRGSGVTPLGVAMAQEGGFERDTHLMLAVAAGAYQACVKSNDKGGARRMLSTVANREGVTDREVCEAMSEGYELKVGAAVFVQGQHEADSDAPRAGGQRRHGAGVGAAGHGRHGRRGGHGARGRRVRVARRVRALHALRGAQGTGAGAG